jgi:hypothetical protein
MVVSTRKRNVSTLPPPNMIGEKKTTFGKAYGTKVWHYWEHIGEHNENLMNFWELDENTLGIENKRKKKKKKKQTPC